MALFFIGVMELLIVTVWTKLVSKTQVLATGFVTIVNVMIWYYVLQAIVNDVSNWKVALLYAVGCAFGAMLGTYAFQIKEGREKKSLPQA